MKTSLFPFVAAIRSCKLPQQHMRQHQREPQLDEEKKLFAHACGSLHVTSPPGNIEGWNAMSASRDSGNSSSSFATGSSSDSSDTTVRVHPRPRSCARLSMMRLVGVDFQGGSDVGEGNAAGNTADDYAYGFRDWALGATKKKGGQSSSFLRRYLGRSRSRGRKYGGRRRQGLKNA